jgi:tetrahydromethanopterin S-methyltransferase subunit E
VYTPEGVVPLLAIRPEEETETPAGSEPLAENDTVPDWPVVTSCAVKLWLAVSGEPLAKGALCVMVLGGAVVTENDWEIAAAAKVVEGATEASMVHPPGVVKCRITGALEEVSEQPAVSALPSIA